jgi:site-specific recombinase XerD
MSTRTSHTSLIAPSRDLEQLIAQAHTFISRARAASTVRAYRSDWSDFTRWCESHRLQFLPATPETIALYISDLASRPLAVATIVRRLTAISKAHAAAGQISPASTRNLVVGDTLRGIKRTLGTAQHRKEALLAKDIRRLVKACPKNLSGTRDKALFLLSFAGAFRRSESSGLTVEDLKFCREGVVCTLRRSKTDQEGAGREVGIPYARNKTVCPVLALKAWLKQAKITSGPVFRKVDRYGFVSRRRGLDPASIAYITKQAARRAGFRHVRDVSGHSFRSGHVSQAVRNGVPEYVVMKQTGHKSREVLSAYIRMGELFEQNAAGGLWM